MVVIDALYCPLTLSLWFDKLTMSDLLITLTLSLSKGKLTTSVISKASITVELKTSCFKFPKVV